MISSIILNPPIKLDTIYGCEQFTILNNKHLKSKLDETTIAFKEQCKRDYKKASDSLTTLLESEAMIKKFPMEKRTDSGWKHYQELNDVVLTLQYFMKENL